MLELSAIDLDDIAQALSDQDGFDHATLIDPTSGELAFWTRDGGLDGNTPVELDDLDLVPIGALPSHVWYRDMSDFVEGVSDDQAGRRLGRAIAGRGAFRRFKDELHEEYPHLLPAWYAFRDSRARRRAVDWLVENELVDPAVAQRYFDEHPEPALP